MVRSLNMYVYIYTHGSLSVTFCSPADDLRFHYRTAAASVSQSANLGHGCLGFGSLLMLGSTFTVVGGLKQKGPLKLT